MKVHTTVIRTADATEEGHAVFRRAVARTHDFSTCTRRWRTVHSGYAPRGIFTAVERDVQSNDRRTSAWRGPLDDDNLRDLAILPKVLVRAQGRDELRAETA